MTRPRLAPLLLAALLLPGVAAADTVRVVSSGGLLAAMRTLAGPFHDATGDTLEVAFGPSMGTTTDAVPTRLARGEPIDVLVMVGSALDALAKDGKASDTVVARSFMGAAVKQGAPAPDVSTAAKLRAVLLAAPSVAVSDSASGVFLQREGWAHLGIAKEMASKVRVIPADPVGGVVARGDVAIGFQQVSELKPVPGITILGPLPPEVSLVTVYAAGVVTGAAHAAAGRRLVDFLRGPMAAGIIAASGMEPVAAGGKP